MLRTRDLLRVAWGGLFLQAAWNEERRQALGFAAALAPLARRWPPGEERQSFLKRHLENVNTNPAMAGYLLGAVAGLEDDAAAGDRTMLGRVTRLKRGIPAPFASAGDAFLWAGLRPATAMVGSCLVWLAGPVGAVSFLILYNIGHLWLRVGGVFRGYARREEIASILGAPALKRATVVLPWFFLAGSLLLGALVLSGSPRLEIALLGLAGAALGLFLGGRSSAHGTLLAAGAMITGLVLARWLDAPP